MRPGDSVLCACLQPGLSLHSALAIGAEYCTFRVPCRPQAVQPELARLRVHWLGLKTEGLMVDSGCGALCVPACWLSRARSLREQMRAAGPRRRDRTGRRGHAACVLRRAAAAVHAARGAAGSPQGPPGGRRSLSGASGCCLGFSCHGPLYALTASCHPAVCQAFLWGYRRTDLRVQP